MDEFRLIFEEVFSISLTEAEAQNLSKRLLDFYESVYFGEIEPFRQII